MGRNLMTMALLGVALAALAAIGLGAAPAAVDLCANLMNGTTLHALPNTTITSAATVTGSFTPPNGKVIEGLPSFCRVTATLKPTPASDIKVEIWLPSESWNGKLVGVGNGGLGGAVTYNGGPDGAANSLPAALKKGYAAASTDTGHAASDMTWLPDETKERDYGYRAIHEMTVAAKAVAKDFYGRAPKRSYFSGCSTGGGQAVGEVQLYPADYDGVIAGSVQNYPTRLRLVDLWKYQVASNDAAGQVPNDKLKLVTQAVLKQCGGSDALADGFLGSDPRTCRFDPQQLVCNPGQDAAACLTAAQARTIQQMYAGESNAHTGQQVWPGEMPGSEEPGGPGAVGWQTSGMNGPKPFFPAAAFYSLGVLENKDVDYHTLDVNSALAMGEKKFGYIDHINPDIDAFLRRGGKLLMYHGWADPQISPANTINYYGSIVEVEQRKRHLDRAAALAETQKSVRLFPVPGMGHCGGGPGPDSFDAMDALDRWVDHGTAPEKIVATHLESGAPAYTRPLCPYPQEAQYIGSGDRKDANNWACTTRPFTFDSSLYKAVKAGGE